MERWAVLPLALLLFAGDAAGQMLWTPLVNPDPLQQVYISARPPSGNPGGGFNFVEAEYGNAGGGEQGNRPNETWAWGYNCSSQVPSHDAPHDPMLCFSLESFYNPGPNNSWIETYLSYTNATQTFTLRPLAIGIFLPTDVVQVSLSGQVHLKDRAEHDVLTTDTGNVRVVNAVITRENNNDWFARQLNAAHTGYVEIVRVDGQDRVVLRGGAAAISSDSELAEGDSAMLLRVKANGSVSLHRVLSGPVDSGGAGYRALRVAN